MISIIIPVYNDPEGLRDTLESLVSQDFEGEYEILPVDNNSSESTAKAINEYEKEYPDLVHGLEENEIQSSYAARNKGIKDAKGDLLCFLDADMLVPDNYLSTVNEMFLQEDVNYVGFDVEIFSDSDNFVSKFNVDNGFNIQKNIEEDNFAPTCCLAVRKIIFEEVGMFDYRLKSGGDSVFGKLVNKKGFELTFCDRIALKHPARDSLSSILGKHVRVKIGQEQRRLYYSDLEDRRPAFSIKNFLPPSPFGFSENFDTWRDLKLRERICFYFIYYMIKLCRPYGALKARKLMRSQEKA